MYVSKYETNDGSGTYYLKGLFLLESRNAAYKVRLLLTLTKPEIIDFHLEVCGYEISLLCCTTVYRPLQLHCNGNLTESSSKSSIAKLNVQLYFDSCHFN